MDNADIFGSLAAGRGPYGGKRGKTRMEQMKNNIVKEWEEEQGRKEAAAKGQSEAIRTADDPKTDKEIRAEEQAAAESKSTVEGNDAKSPRRWRFWKTDRRT